MDVHFNGYKIKYSVLDYFFRNIESSQKIKYMNIFISLDDLFHTLHRPLINNEFQLCGTNADKQLISNILNILGHYRNWAIKHNINPKVYGIYSSHIRSFKNNIYISDYRKKFKEYMDPLNTKFYFINDAIKSAMPLAQTISEYIPDVYIIDSKYLEPSIIPLYIASEVFKMDWNILISRDTYDLQYAYRDKWSLFSAKGENSKYLTRKNLWNYINEKEHVFKDSIDLTYDHELYILSKAIVGDVYRNIPRLRKIGWKTLFKYLDIIRDEYSEASPTTAQIALIELLRNKKLTQEELNNNLYTINIEKQLETVMEIDRMSILSQIKDVPDYENIKQINSRYFLLYPLNLQFLCNELIDTKSRYKSPFDINKSI